MGRKDINEILKTKSAKLIIGLRLCNTIITIPKMRINKKTAIGYKLQKLTGDIKLYP
jgi:hypothetical protein